MKYVDWLDRVLAAVADVDAEMPAFHSWGLAQVAAKLDVEGENAEEATWDALRDLSRYGYIDLSQHHMKLEQDGRAAAEIGIRTAWPTFARFLTPQQEVLLKRIVQASEQQSSDHAWLADIVVDEIASDLSGHEILRLGEALAEAEFIDKSRITAGSYKVFPTYGGVVRATERVNNEIQELVLGLLPDWETANVDFKREMSLASKDQRIEFARDVMALANTQVTGDRYLVIGFHPTSREFVPGTELEVTQDQMEDTLNDLVRPAVELRFRRGDWIDGTGPVAVIEVVRDRANLPYSAKRDARGEKKSIAEGDVFLRRGTHVALADDRERDELVAEAAWARRVRGPS